MKKNLILQYPHLSLKTPCSEVHLDTPSQFYYATKTMLPKMKMAMHLCHGVGLAANQLGFQYRVFTYIDDGIIKAMINPVIEDYSVTTEVAQEGCLSLEGQRFDIERSTHIVIKGYDTDLKEINTEVSGYTARIFQHECDHLNGLVLLDRLKEENE